MKTRSLILLMAICASQLLSAAPIRVLGIGNSFTMDAMGRELQPIFTSEAQEVILGYPFRGGTWLSQHDAWKNRTDTMPYNYYEYRNGIQTTTGTSSYNMTMAVEKEPWDYVIIQSDHDSAGIYKSYEPYLTHLVDYVKAHCSNKNVKIGFYMTWPYDSISTYSAFKYYKYNNQLMYDSIIACAKRVMQTHPEFFLVPVGTAIQNARTSYMGHRMNRDGYHLNYTYGNYAAALCWYRAIMGKNPKEITYYPGAISEYCAHMCQAAAYEAFEKPYEVTSLKKDFGRSEGDVQAADESRLRRVTFNGMNVPIVEQQYDYVVKVDASMDSIGMFSYARSSKAEQNITDAFGSDVPRCAIENFYPLVTPALGDTVVYTNKVIAEDLVHTTTYTFRLVGAKASEIVYSISSSEDLLDFAATVNSGQYGIHGVLTNNINMNHTRQNCWETPIGTYENPYTGTFDGQGYTISGFEIYAAMNVKLAALKGVGLFGAIKDATVRGVHIVGGDESYFNKTTDTSIIPEVKTQGAGILCGYMTHSLIEDCSVTMDVYTDQSNLSIGLICGRDGANNQLNRINRCWAAGTWRIRQNGVYGGILGYSNYVKLTNCYNLSKLDLQRNYGARIGGLVGYGNTSAPKSVTIENSYNYGAITDNRGSKSVTVYMGAIGGYMNGIHVQTNCYYLVGSCTKANGTGTPTTPDSVAAADMTNGALVKKLGGEFVQGTEYPILRDVKGEYTCTKAHSDLAQEYGWQTSDTCISFRLGAVTFTTKNTSTSYKNGFYRNGKEWCLYYQHGNGPLHIQADEGYWIKDVTFSYKEYSDGILSNVTGAGQTEKIYFNDSTIVVNDTEKQFYVGNTKGTGGFLGFTKFSVTYYKLPTKVELQDQLLTVGNVFQLTPTILPGDAYAAHKWSVDNNAIVSVDAEGIVTAKAPGTAYITATLVNDVTTTCKVVVVGNTNQSVVETFSNCQVEQNQNGTVSVIGDGGLYTWKLTNYQRQTRDTVGAEQGVRIRYSGDIETDGVQQGGIKSIAFDWRATGKNNPVDFRVKVGSNVQTYLTDPIGSDAIIKHYAYDFRQTTNTSMAISIGAKQAINQTFIIVGPITITPYLLYTQYTDTIQLPQASYDCTSQDLLINNTDGEGEVVYAIQADSTGQASIQDGVLNLSQVTRTGDIVVKASWNEGKVFTTFNLHVIQNGPTALTDLNQSKHPTKILRDQTILIQRDEQLYDVLGRKH